MLSYKEFRKLAKLHYYQGGKHFLKTWDSKKYLWYNNYEPVTKEVALRLMKESMKNRW